MREAAQSMRRNGIHLPSANWTPPWEYVPDPNPLPDKLNQYGCVPAFYRHPTCDPTAAERPAAPPMDFPLYPDYHAQVTGNARVGMQPESLYVRASADDFYQSQLTRGS
eukprot:2204319-Pyramimonas_sp.AAC.1